jgi:hypothetical protein
MTASVANREAKDLLNWTAGATRTRSHTARHVAQKVFTSRAGSGLPLMLQIKRRSSVLTLTDSTTQITFEFVECGNDRVGNLYPDIRPNSSLERAKIRSIASQSGSRLTVRRCRVPSPRAWYSRSIFKCLAAVGLFTLSGCSAGLEACALLNVGLSGLPSCETVAKKN